MSKVEVDLTRATRLLQPGPVTIVTARHKDKQNGMVAAWVTPVSNDPPMVAVAIYPGRFTHELLQKSNSFALNIPPRPLAEKVKKLGEVSGEDVDKFVTTKLDLYAGSQVSAPLISECIGHLECGIIETIRTGNHTLFIAEIVAASAEDTAFNGDYWTLADESVKPLHHLGGAYYALLDQPFQV